MTPNLFIVGSPKCGTTTLADWLGKHEDVFFSPMKEPHFFNTDLGNRRSRSFDEYLSLFEDGRGAKIRAEGSVWYLYSEQAISNAMKQFPDALFIACVRDPVSMVPSLHSQLLFNNTEDEPDVEEAFSLEQDRREGRRIPSTCEEPKLLYYSKTCANGDLVKRLFETVPENQRLVVFLEDIVDHPEKTWFSICRFCEIPEISLSGYENANPASRRRFKTLGKLMKHILYFRKKHDIRIPGERFGLPELLRKAAHRIDAANRTTRKKQAISPEFHKKLLETFDQDITLLEHLTRRNLSHWKS